MSEKLNRRAENLTGHGGHEVQEGQGPEKVVRSPEGEGMVLIQSLEKVSMSTTSVDASNQQQDVKRQPAIRGQDGLPLFLRAVYPMVKDVVAFARNVRTVVSHFLAAFSEKEPPAVPVGA